jgi:hypothetical protein
MTAGDTVSVSLRADLVGGDYTWIWETRVIETGSSRAKAHFRQSTFLGESVSPRQLGRWRGSYRPTLPENGRIDLEILRLMDGSLRNEEIARIAAERFPKRFESPRHALTRVAQLIEMHGE